MKGEETMTIGSELIFIIKLFVASIILIITLFLLKKDVNIKSYIASIGGVFLVAVIFLVPFEKGVVLDVLGIKIDSKLENVRDTLVRVQEVEKLTLDTEKRLEQARAEAEDLRKAVADDIRTMSDLIDGIENNTAELAEKNKKLEERTQDVETKSADVESAVSQATEKISLINDRSEQLKHDVSTAESDIIGIRKQIANLSITTPIDRDINLDTRSGMPDYPEKIIDSHGPWDLCVPLGVLDPKPGSGCHVKNLWEEVGDKYWRLASYEMECRFACLSLEIDSLEID
jgi:hypothetical protein